MRLVRNQQGLLQSLAQDHWQCFYKASNGLTRQGHMLRVATLALHVAQRQI